MTTYIIIGLSLLFLGAVGFLVYRKGCKDTKLRIQTASLEEKIEIERDAYGKWKERDNELVRRRRTALDWVRGKPKEGSDGGKL